MNPYCILKVFALLVPCYFIQIVVKSQNNATTTYLDLADKALSTVYTTSGSVYLGYVSHSVKNLIIKSRYSNGNPEVLHVQASFGSSAPLGDAVEGQWVDILFLQDGTCAGMVYWIAPLTCSMHRINGKIRYNELDSTIKKMVLEIENKYLYLKISKLQDQWYGKPAPNQTLSLTEYSLYNNTYKDVPVLYDNTGRPTDWETVQNGSEYAGKAYGISNLNNFNVTVRGIYKSQDFNEITYADKTITLAPYQWLKAFGNQVQDVQESFNYKEDYSHVSANSKITYYGVKVNKPKK